ncbi:MAG: PEP-CTERM sorting domain-containing protein, partial [Snowella sp.]
GNQRFFRHPFFYLPNLSFLLYYGIIYFMAFSYIGDGTTTFTATGDLSDGFYSGKGASGVFFSGTSILSADAIVTYTYTENPPAPPVAAVPEPLTILGAATAVGFGAAFKRRALKNSKA